MRHVLGAISRFSKFGLWNFGRAVRGSKGLFLARSIMRYVIETDGLFARAIQHETDHLFGKLFIDRMSSAKKLAIRRQLKEMQQRFG